MQRIKIYIHEKTEMTKLYKSKIGLEVVIPLVLVFGIVLFFTFSKGPSWLGIAILLPLIVFMIHMIMTTYYTINGNSLTIKCGFLFNKTIDISSIKKISETNNPISSPATSIDRLEITYGKYNSVIISPKQKQQFINDITTLNPKVEVKFKKKRNETASTTRQ